MIILDTNVVSEPLRPNPDPSVMEWLDGQDVETLWFTAIGLAELFTGLETMPEGKRRTHLETNLAGRLSLLFGARILSFTAESAVYHSQLAASAQARGIAISFADAQIAALALQHDYAVATRDLAPFAAAGVRVIDPWRIPAA